MLVHFHRGLCQDGFRIRMVPVDLRLDCAALDARAGCQGPGRERRAVFLGHGDAHPNLATASVQEFDEVRRRGLGEACFGYSSVTFSVRCSRTRVVEAEPKTVNCPSRIT
eukprot:scaffold117180_cov62-Phaeocystis_antarctica.AAC.6